MTLNSSPSDPILKFDSETEEFVAPNDPNETLSIALGSEKKEFDTDCLIPNSALSESVASWLYK